MAEENEKEEKRDDADAGTLLKTCIDRLDALHKRMDAMDRKDAEKEEEEEPKRAAADEAEKEEEKKSDSTVFYRGEKAPKPKDAKSDAEEDLKREEAKKDSKESEKEENEKSGLNDRKDKAMADAFDPREAIAQLERRLPKLLTDAERAEFSEVQARADSVYHAFGQRAPAPLEGETLMAYRQRLAKKLKSHSPGFKDVNLYAIADEAAFTAIENTIYADSMKVAFSPATTAPGTLRAISETRGGHEFISYVGDPAAWMNGFAGPVRMHVTSINTPNGGQH